ncbi:hypothetical protein CF104_20200 [Aeromonas jandaei]|nr:hypothetical protein CF104_20200 [Aeromonas jandaei]
MNKNTGQLCFGKINGDISDKKEILVRGFNGAASYSVLVEKDSTCTEDELRKLIETETINLNTDTYAKHIDDIHGVSQNILTDNDKTTTQFICVGQSPKPVAWDLQQKGANVKSINVSNAGPGVTRTADYKNYIDNKIGTIDSNMHRIVVIDFIDSGNGLQAVTDDVKESLNRLGRDNVEVKSCGITVKGRERPNDSPIDKYVDGNYFGNELFAQSFKKMGRHHEKNPQGKWSAEILKKSNPSKEIYLKNKTILKGGLIDGFDSVKKAVDSHNSNAENLRRAAFVIMPKSNDESYSNIDEEDWV